MDRFLLHLLLLSWASVAAAGALAPRSSERFLAAGLLAWGNLVVTSLVLAAWHRLGDGGWFLGISLSLAGATILLARRGAPAGDDGEADRIPTRLLTGFVLGLAPFAAAVAATAWIYSTNNPDALSWQLPRSMFYLGQGSLAHFDAGDPQLVLAPFNHDLVQMFGLRYGAPPPSLNFINLLAWLVAGTAVYRLGRLAGAGAAASLLAAWAVLVAAPVLAQAATTTPDLPAGAAALSAVVFAIRWQRQRQAGAAWLAGLAAGLAAGTTWNALGFALLAGALALTPVFRPAPATRWASLRPWIGPALLASALALPFFLINLHAGRAWAAGVTPDNGSRDWSGFLSLWPRASRVLTEDSVGFGPVGLVCLLVALYWAVRPRQGAEIARWCAGLGLAWLAVGLWLTPAASLHPRTVLPALLLMGPGLAAVLDAGWLRSRRLMLLVGLGVTLVTGWSAHSYLLDNQRRPLRPVLEAVARPSSLPLLPPALAQPLAVEPWVNVDTDGSREALFPFMVLKPHQRFTARHQSEPTAYNLFSRFSLSQNAGLRDLTTRPVYTILRFPGKVSAGVQHLATVGRGAEARDYFGLIRWAGQIVSTELNQFLLVTLTARVGPAGSRLAEIRVAGLNPADSALLTVAAAGAPDAPLATFTADSTTTVTLADPDSALILKLRRVDTGIQVSSTVLPAITPATGQPEPPGPGQAADARTLFITDLVLADDTSVKVSDGLQPTEGPFPQWNLPYLRWARKPSVQLRIPPVPGLVLLRLSFSARLHVRETARLEILFNGRSVHQFRMAERTQWMDQTLELTPQPGENILEFRDVPLSGEIDWLEYLERYPDVKKHLLAHNIPLEAGAREHYEISGRTEGRTVQVGTAPPPENDFYFMFRSIRLEGEKAP